MSMTREEFEAWVDSKTVQMTWSRGTMPMLYADEVKELFDLLVPAWVKCSESLPEIGERVLYKIKYDDEPVIGWRKQNGDWSTDSKNHGYFQGWDGGMFPILEEAKNVTHWMPLPPLPAEEV